MPIEGSPNSKTWRDQAEEHAAALVDVTAQLEDAEQRLAEIAAIAAPDQEERLHRIEEKLDQLLKHLAPALRAAQE